MSANEIVPLIGQVGFPIAIAVYLLWERTKVFTAQKEDDKADRAVLIAVVTANTVAQTELRVTIQKLCEIVNRKDQA